VNVAISLGAHLIVDSIKDSAEGVIPFIVWFADEGDTFKHRDSRPHVGVCRDAFADFRAGERFEIGETMMQTPL
jgi:hypothetical protein